MNYTKELLEKDRVKFTVEVDTEEWKDAIEKAYEKNKGKYQIEGFRKGKVPRKVIENMYGIGVFFDDALDIILPKTYGEVLDKESELFPVDTPEVDIVAISDTTLKYTATVQLRPEVKLGAYTGLEFKKDKVRVTEKEVDEEIAKRLENAGSWEDIGDRGLANGDKANLDYSGSVDGVKFEGGTAQGQTLVIGSGSFIPGFEEQMIGMKKGESKDITVKFPEDYHAKELAGKEAVFAITLNEATEKKVPELNDESVKDISECDTVEEFKKSVKEEISDKKKDAADAKLENEMMDTFVKNANVEIPECMIKTEAEQMVEEVEYRLMYQGMRAEDYYKMIGTTREEVIKKEYDNAKKNVLYRLVFQAIVKAVGIVVSDEEVDEEIKKDADVQKMEFEQYKKNIGESGLNYYRRAAVGRKVFAYLKNNNEIK